MFRDIRWWVFCLVNGHFMRYIDKFNVRQCVACHNIEEELDE